MLLTSGKKLEDICPSTHNMEVPNVKRKDYQLIGMDDDFLSLMDDSGDTRDDLKCPSEDNDIGKEIIDAIANEADILVSPTSHRQSRCCPNCCPYNPCLRSPSSQPAERSASSLQKSTPLSTNNVELLQLQLSTKTGNMWPDFVTEL